MVEIRFASPIPPSLSAEERNKWKAWQTANRAKEDRIIAVAVERFGCAQCKAIPGDACVWRVRHSDVVHAPRRSRAWHLLRGAT